MLALKVRGVGPPSACWDHARQERLTEAPAQKNGLEGGGWHGLLTRGTLTLSDSE